MKLDPCNYMFETPRSQSSTIKPAPRDIFAEAREKFTIEDLWHAFGFKGQPKGTCKSPFRDDCNPSFSIYDDGKAWTDHATGDHGDVIEFARHALGRCEHKAVREWFSERPGIDYLAHFQAAPRLPKASQPPKVIQWPAGIRDGTTGAWHAFATSRGIAQSTAWTLVKSGMVRPCTLDGHDCYVVTDRTYRAAEIRRADGKPFWQSKAYPLKGVDKSWLPGADWLRQGSPEKAVIVTEGGTDLLAAVDLYSRYRRIHGGKNLWQPVALLGAGCKLLAPECAELIRGRHVRLVPDADDAGDRMRDHWTDLFRRLGCSVDAVTLPRGTDLTDHLSTISPTDLFSI